MQELEDYYFIFVTDFVIHLFHMKHESTTSKGVLVGGQSENLNTLDHNGSMMVWIFENNHFVGVGHFFNPETVECPVSFQR